MENGLHTWTGSSRRGGHGHAANRADTFASLWPLTEGRRVEKVRYRVPWGAHTIEVDVYDGALQGLVTAEVEFGSEPDSARFARPDWLGPEVTDDPRYQNQHLALHGPPGRTKLEERR